MKLALIAALIAIIAPSIAQAAATPAPKLTKWQQHQHEMLVVSAPGDEYFGRQKMSYLGINNIFRNATITAGEHTVDPNLIHTILPAEESLHAWGQKYPHDPQLARSYFLAEQLYQKVWVQTYQDKAWQYMHIIIKRFPTSYFGKQVKKNLAIGFTEHYYAEPQPCAIPEATPTPGKGKAKATPTPAPTDTPTPEATPTPKPGQPKVDIITPPCVPPATPLEAPSVAPSSTPT